MCLLIEGIFYVCCLVGLYNIPDESMEHQSDTDSVWLCYSVILKKNVNYILLACGITEFLPTFDSSE
jgi:hypothetical protein